MQKIFIFIPFKSYEGAESQNLEFTIQPTGEKTHTNQQCERLAKIRQTTGNI
jgi:hypothetical protein